MPESLLEEIGEDVFRKYLATQIYPESRSLVAAHQAMGHTVAIVSSATRYQAEPLARDMRIEHVLCSELEVENGVFTGRVHHPTCYGEGKAVAARRLARAHKISMKKSYFYTDSHEDLPLLEAVGRPHALNPNRQLAQIARERRWPVHRFRSRGTPSLGDLVRTSLVYGSMVPSLVAGAAAGVISGSLNSGSRHATGCRVGASRLPSRDGVFVSVIVRSPPDRLVDAVIRRRHDRRQSVNTVDSDAATSFYAGYAATDGACG